MPAFGERPPAPFGAPAVVNAYRRYQPNDRRAVYSEANPNTRVCKQYTAQPMVTQLDWTSRAGSRSTQDACDPRKARPGPVTWSSFYSPCSIFWNIDYSDCGVEWRGGIMYNAALCR